MQNETFQAERQDPKVLQYYLTSSVLGGYTYLNGKTWKEAQGKLISSRLFHNVIVLN